ncbi:TRAP-type C4-dicarboxylate transport system permease small subunit [Halanaerobium saccharolyticum]|uniref:TRAP-type C4-dicarboxylate transport system permease small subunit n=2 Tax=Halanaerobium saccharolyticum TaxID=43595 RepID=A0A4R7Z826_9FIRM|nr:TRAP transporter small permease [Halanaerobium saccharolyticum]TDW07292.1 TRAP-type C4-dicarboxylate transport system permease small subunit [Halanaerobium saccharolyticum]
MKDKSFSSIFASIYKYILILLTLIMFVIVGANVFARFILNSSLGWADELARFIFIWISFLGAVFAYTTDDHVGLNFVVAKIKSAKAQNIVNIISDLLILLVVGFITYYGYIVAISATNVSPALYIPMSLVYAVVPVSGFMMVVINFIKIKKHIELYIKDEKEKFDIMEDIGGAE